MKKILTMILGLVGVTTFVFSGALGKMIGEWSGERYSSGYTQGKNQSISSEMGRLNVHAAWVNGKYRFSKVEID